MTDSSLPPLAQTSTLPTVQHTSDISNTRFFLKKTYFYQKIQLSVFELIDTECFTLCNLLVAQKHVMVLKKTMMAMLQHFCVYVSSQMHNYLLTLRSHFITEKNSKFFLRTSKTQYFKTNWLFSSRETLLWHDLPKPLNIISKGDSIKCYLDARHLNSSTDQSDESWPIGPLAPQLARAVRNTSVQ